MNQINSEQTWFTEICAESGSAFSLQTKKKLHAEKTPFQTIEIYETKTFGKLLVIDGFVMLSERDNFIYHEMMTHPALFSHPKPRHVVIVGGGDCGTLKEVAKHVCVESITQIEIDERVTRLSEKYFAELCSANNDPRARFEFKDAIEWMQHAPANSIDLIIIDSTDPIGPAEGLFKQSFYESCLHALRPDGIVVQQSESPLLHWQSIAQPMQTEMQQAGFSCIRTLFFPVPVYPSGWWSATMASSQDLHFVRDKDAKAAGFSTRYYNYDVHLGAFSLPNFLRNN